MTPLVAGQRWVPSDGCPAIQLGPVHGSSARWVSDSGAQGENTVAEVEAWIATRDARLAQDEGGA